MSATEQDRERAARALVASSWSADIESVAAALADERERARAPFLAVAADLDADNARWSRAPVVGLRAAIAEDIRRAAEDPR